MTEKVKVRKRYSPKHGSRDKWRLGCRCAPCRLAHNDDTTEWRRARNPVTPDRQDDLAKLIAAGVTFDVASAAVGLTWPAVVGRCVWDVDFRARLDEAWRTAYPALPHSTDVGYRGGCHCSGCRRAHRYYGVEEL